MTEKEWAALSAMIDNWWGQPEFTREREEAYFEVLRDHDATTVERAIRELLAEGGKFTPSLAELIAKVEVPDSDHSLRFGAALRAMGAACEAGVDHPQRFLEVYHPLYLQFWQEHPEFPSTDKTDVRYLRDLQFAWRDLVAEWTAGLRRRAVIAQLEHRPLVASRVSGPRRLGEVAAAALPERAGD